MDTIIHYLNSLYITAGALIVLMSLMALAAISLHVYLSRSYYGISARTQAVYMSLAVVCVSVASAGVNQL